MSRGIRVPDSLIYELIDGGGGRDVRRGSLRVVLNYVVPPSMEKLDRGYVDLRPMTAIGFMGMGKTVFFTQITRLLKTRLKRRFGEEALALASKSIVDLVEYIRDNPDLLRGRKAVVLFVDDMFYQGVSTERSKAKELAEKYYSDIRHKPEELGFNTGVLYTFFAGQRYSKIPPFFRNTPIIVFKPLIAVDRYEKGILLDVLDYRKDDLSKAYANLMLEILATAAKLYYQTWDDKVKSITVIRPAWDWPFIYIQTDLPNPRKVFDINVPFNYSGVYGEDEEEVMRRIDETAKKLLLKLAIKSIAVGMELRDKGIYSLSKKLYTDVLRNVLGLPFNQNDVTWEFIEEAVNEIDTMELKKLIELRTSKPIENLLLVKHN